MAPAHILRIHAARGFSISGKYNDMPARVPPPTSCRFCTIGHSTRSIEEFVGLLRENAVRLIVDVRTVPRSRTNPQYNADTLPVTLSGYQIGYQHLADLGGLRRRDPMTPEAVNGFWQNASFHNYADYAMSDAFHVALGRLRALGHETPCAIMCAESVWWRCHRRIIADYLLAAGESVFHILGSHHTDQAQLTEGSKLLANGKLTYPSLV